MRIFYVGECRGLWGYYISGCRNGRGRAEGESVPRGEYRPAPITSGRMEKKYDCCKDYGAECKPSV